MTTRNPWFVTFKANPSARLRLFCFPYAGGGPPAFRSWAADWPDWVEMTVVQYPGRGARFIEPAYDSVFPLVAALVAEIGAYLDRPFAFFGHSMGGLIAFELARALRRQGGSLPTRLIVSAADPPHLPLEHKHVHTLPDDELKAELLRYNGTPAEVLAHDELLALMLPLLRADFSIYETYTYTQEAPLACPIVSLGGEADPRVAVERLSAWAAQTSAGCHVHTFPGDHFYFNDNWPALLKTLVHYLQE